MRLALIHAVLLVAALLFAYQTWTRDDRPSRVPESVVVWRADAEDVERITYQGERVRLVLEPRTDPVGSYVWGTATFTRPATAAGAPAPDSVVQFVGDEQAEALVEGLASPLALRDLGVVDDERRPELGLADSDVRVTIEVDGEARELRVGGIVFASGDRYVENTADGRAYVFEARILNGLENGGSILIERRVARAPTDRIAEVTLVTPSSTRTMRRITDANGQTAWATSEAPDRPDQTFGALMERLGQLTIVSYHPEVDPASLEELASLEYRDARGQRLEQLRLLRSAGTEPDYFVASEHTRAPARVFSSSAGPLAEDIAQLF